ncbi:MAG: DUF2794 domain-containing protein [Rhodobacteraceae bacterium]|nr:DUF2794 domain-containing protein [Paracoccaceae bacterium]
MPVYNLAEYRSNKPTHLQSPLPVISYNRTELGVIMSLYGRMVASGIWRDYGISHLKDVAIFSIFRRTADFPLYRIEKHPDLKARNSLYIVKAMDGQILKRGNELKRVISVLDKRNLRLVG